MRKVHKYDPVWKRWKTITIVDEPKVHSGVEHQLDLNLGATREATDEEWDEWQEKELNWWGKIQIPLVAFMAFVQVFMFGSMLMAFWLIDRGFNG